MKIFKKLWLILALFGSFASAYGTVITSSNVNGGKNWSDPAAWVGGAVPAATDTVAIEAGDSITLDVDASCMRLNMRTPLVNSLFKINDGITLTVSGNVVLNFSTVNSTNTTLDVANGTLTANTITLLSSADDSRKTVLKIGNGTVNTNFLDLSTTGSILRRNVTFTGIGTLNVNGSVNGNATLTSFAGSTVYYSSQGSHSIISGTYSNLIVSGGVKTLVANTTVNSTLNLNGAVIKTSTFDLSLANAATIANSEAFSDSNMISTDVGMLIKNGTNVAQFQMTYPIGSDGKYAPFVINTLTTAPSGALGMRTVQDKNYFLKANNYINRYWLFTGNLNFNFADAYLMYNDADVVGTETSIDLVQRLNGAGWLNITGSSVVTATNKIQFTSTGSTQLRHAIVAAETAGFNAVSETYTIANGSMSTASNWSTAANPTSSTNVVILHRMSDGTLTCNDLTITKSAKIDPVATSLTVNGTTTVDGILYDSHGGGTNTFKGNLVINSIGQFNFPGNGTSGARFKGNIYNYGTFRLVPGNGTVFFDTTSTLKTKVLEGNKLNFSGNNPIVSLVDTLFINVDTVTSFGLNIGVATNANLHMKVVNNAYFYCSDRINGVLPTTPIGTEQRIWVNGANSFLRVGSNTPMGIGTLVATATGNTIEYAADAAQTISGTDHYNILITGARQDRDKNLPATPLVFNVLGDIVIKSNGARMAFGATGQTLNVAGDIVLEGNAQFTTHQSIDRICYLNIGGSIINNAAVTAFNARQSATRKTIVNFTGAGNVMTGSGICQFDTVYFSNPGAVTYDVSRINIVKAIINNAGSLEANTNFTYLDYGFSPVTIGGSSPITFSTLQSANRYDRNLTVEVRTNLTVKDSLAITHNGNATDGGKFILNGNNLTIKGKYAIASSGTISAIIPDANASIIFENSISKGTLKMNAPKVLKNLSINSTDTITLGSGILVKGNLNLIKGQYKNGTTTDTRITMDTNATVVRKDGSIFASLYLNTGASYNVEYSPVLGGITTGPELLTTATALKNLTFDAGANTVALGASTPTVNGDLIYKSGTITATNYIKLAAIGKMKFPNTFATTTLPVGTPTYKLPVELELTTLTGGDLNISLFDGAHPNKPTNVLSYLNIYGDLTGTASAFNGNIKIYYNSANVVGTESDLLGAGYNAGWAYGGPVDALNHTLSGPLMGYASFSALSMPADSIAILSALSVSDVTLSPVFNSDSLTYYDTVANAISIVTVTPTAASSVATIKVNGSSVTSGNASGNINLSVGNNIITVSVTAEDGISKQDYVINVYRDIVSTVSSLNASSLNVYPIPATDVITLDGVSSNSVISIVNMAGQVVSTQTAIGTSLTLDVNALKAGKYVLVINDGTAVITKDFIKK